MATGVYGHGDAGNGELSKNSGEALRPATLPVWLHKRNVQNKFGSNVPTPETPVPDAYTGATPESDFQLVVKTDKPLNGKYRIYLEINQPWDFIDYWNSTKFPDNKHYKSSCQPSVAYAVTIDTKTTGEYFLNPVGHGHYACEDGKLYTDLSGFTTALTIAKKISLTITINN